MNKTNDSNEAGAPADKSAQVGPVLIRRKTGRVKAAWIRDNVPPGAPAPGRFDCECGRPVRAGYFGQGPAVTCDCGLVYDSHGYISEPGTIWNSDGTAGPVLICAPGGRS
jgi:hypothetical protein